MKNKNTWMVIKLIIAWLSYIPLGLLIIESKGFNDLYDTFGISNSILGYYITENAFDMAFMGILTIGLFILILNRFKYTKEVHFNVSMTTKIIILATLSKAILGMIAEVTLNRSNHSIHADIGEFLKQLLWVGLVEELIFRGFIFISLLKLKTSKYKVVHIVLLSAFMFSIIHLPAFFLYNDSYNVLSIFWRLLFPFVIGVLYAYLLYMNKDIISLIFIHATSNMISNFSGISGLLLALIFWAGLLYYTYRSYQQFKSKVTKVE